MNSLLQLIILDGKRASDDDIIVNICWELGDLVVDYPIGLGDSDAEKKQSPRAQIHDSSPWHERKAIAAPFYTIWISTGTETLNTGMYYQHPTPWSVSSLVLEDCQKRRDGRELTRTGGDGNLDVGGWRLNHKLDSHVRNPDNVVAN